MKILIVSDTWHPQVNGVVRILEMTAQALQKLGHETRIVGPDATRWSAIAAPTYPSITLEFFARLRIRRVIKEFRPDFIHIATEGPLGWTARNLCLHRHRPFTTSYHTRFPEYLAARVPRWLMSGMRALTYAYLRHFHFPSNAVMTPASSIEDILRRRKFRNLTQWSWGVDTNLFQPYGKNLDTYAFLPRPILLYVGRVAVEKSLNTFLALKTPGSKIVIGDGPALPSLRAAYPDAHFPGFMKLETLVRHYAAADLFVFPSTTDTFGLVLLEACACGLRIASVPAPGPADLFAGEAARAFAVLDDDLGRAVECALALPDDPSAPRRFAEKFSWAASTRQFLGNLQAGAPKIDRQNRPTAA